MPDGVARKLEYLGRDSTRASQLLRDFLRHAALQLRRGHEAAISRWVAPLSVTSCLSVSLMDMNEPFASLGGVNPIEAITDASPGSACERAKGHPDRASAFRQAELRAGDTILVLMGWPIGARSPHPARAVLPADMGLQIYAPDAASHMCAVVSADAVTTRVPLGLNCALAMRSS